MIFLTAIMKRKTASYESDKKTLPGNKTTSHILLSSHSSPQVQEYVMDFCEILFSSFHIKFCKARAPGGVRSFTALPFHNNADGVGQTHRWNSCVEAFPSYYLLLFTLE